MSRDPCKLCEEPLDDDDHLLVCSVCLVEHHAACYIANGITCASCGADATPIDPEQGKVSSDSGAVEATPSGTGPVAASSSGSHPASGTGAVSGTSDVAASSSGSHPASSTGAVAASGSHPASGTGDVSAASVAEPSASGSGSFEFSAGSGYAPASPSAEPQPNPAPEPTGPVLLELKDVVAGFGAMEVLHGVSLEVREGEIVALIGANGAGKTTTLNVISNVVKARKGEVRLAGDRTSGRGIQETVRRGIIHVPEGRRLFSELTVLENLEMGAFLRNDKDGIQRDIKRMYEMFPILEQRKSQRGGSLSGGEQQMLAIARGLMAQPKLLLLDEPSLGLAPIICQQIFRTVRELNAKEGVTVFIVEQNAHAALDLAHRAYVMETGDVIMSGPAKQLADDPRVKAAYLGE